METLAQGVAQGLLARWAQALRLRSFLLNYSKFIHLCDRYPVYSLTTPVLFSPPAAHFIACTFYGGIQNRNLHNLLSLAITDGCNARCDYCSLPELCRLIGDAQQLGVSILNLVGGRILAAVRLWAGGGAGLQAACTRRWMAAPGAPTVVPWRPRSASTGSRATSPASAPVEVSPRRAPRPA